MIAAYESVVKTGSRVPFECPKMTQQDFDDHLALVINEAIESWEKLQESYHEEDD